MILKIPIRLVSLEAEGFHLFVDAELNGKLANLLIDTGASKTVFDINRISKFVRKRKKSFESFEKLSTGLGTNTMKSHFTTVKKFGIGELIIENFQVILLDMAHVNQSYDTLGLKPIDGVLGSDLLMKHKAVIDYEKALLKLKI
jgi:predicted aspartyl protease